MLVRDVIKRSLPGLTPSQRKIANAILADYPFAGLQTIQDLSARLGVSAPSVSRYVNRLGYCGFQEFQLALIDELREGSRSPVDIRANVADAPSGAFLSDYARRFARVAELMGNTIPNEQLSVVADLLGDRTRRIYLRGGRVSDCLARFLSIHLKQIREGVRHMPDDLEAWPEIVLSLRRQDVVVMFDFRRYQPSLERLAASVAAQGRGTIVLVTDKWQSPIARHSSQVVALPIDVGTAWDTAACPMAFIEAIIVIVADRDWPKAQGRIENWDCVRRTLGHPTNEAGDEHDA